MTDKFPPLVAKDIFFTYPGSNTPALDGVSLNLDRGELLGLIGPNGAGKTSLISVLTTLLRPQRGSLHVCGIDALADAAGVRGTIGYVPQDLALYERFTGLENIHFFGRMYGLGRRELLEKAQYYLEMFGLYEKRGRLVATYSGGMKRRINLIVGLIHEPDLLFLDEPTVGIDAQSRHMILEKLTALNHRGMAMLYTSHYLEEVQQLCRRVVIIDGGRILAEGTPQDLIAQAEGCGSLADMFLLKTGVSLRD